MSMVCGLDLHRGQITFDTLDVDSGEMWRGRLWRAERQRFRRWLREDLSPRAGDGPVAIAVEGCTGWRYVVEEVDAAGFECHVAEPADTQAMRARSTPRPTAPTPACCWICSRGATFPRAGPRPTRFLSGASGADCTSR